MPDPTPRTMTSEEVQSKLLRWARRLDVSLYGEEVALLLDADTAIDALRAKLEELPPAQLVPRGRTDTQLVTTEGLEGLVRDAWHEGYGLAVEECPSFCYGKDRDTRWSNSDTCSFCQGLIEKWEADHA